MTELPFEPESPDLDQPNVPLDPWMLSMVRDATAVDDVAIPREMMWARVQQQRQSGIANASRPRLWLARAAGIAALVLGGIGIGRYLMPVTGPSKYQLALSQSAERADSIAALGLGPEALAALPRADDPAHVAMEEHLVSTVALLTTVRDEDPSRAPAADVSGRARDLLGTTRMLLDEPQLRDERTRRLLQDLELVLVQIVQARTSAPETKRAPSETMRETNLLPRVRAAATASRRGDDPTLGGGGL
jgi:hypothetical protein